MPLFERLFFVAYKRGLVSRWQLVGAWRLMRSYAKAHRFDEVLPTVPTWLKRWPAAPLWAGFRVSVEQPVVFVVGVFAAPLAVPTILYVSGRTLYRIFGWVF